MEWEPLGAGSGLNVNWDSGLWHSYILVAFLLPINITLSRDTVQLPSCPKADLWDPGPKWKGSVQVEERGASVLAPHQLLGSVNVSRTWLALSSSHHPHPCKSTWSLPQPAAVEELVPEYPLKVSCNSVLSLVHCKLLCNVHSCY